jgi:ubiquinone/menaquinone biosynthesis C-methylase UbiE
MNKWIRFAFRQFYTTFAWTYDTVASIVSFGEWKVWGACAIPFIRGAKVLEIAHGPGHLQLELRRRGMQVVGIDLSAQMNRMAVKRLRASGFSNTLSRASAMQLPFADNTFETVVSTFPSEFIFQDETLSEAHRVLVPHGRFVIVPTTQFRSKSAATQTIEATYRATGQRASNGAFEKFERRFNEAGFVITTHIAQTKRANVVVWVCHPREN